MTDQLTILDTAEGKVLNILLVEDDEIDAEQFKRELRKQGIGNPVFHVEDGVEGLAALRDGRVPRPLVIVLDLNMPRMGGHEFLAELRADPSLRGTVVFVLTTSKDDVDVVRAYEQYVAGYVLKTDPGRSFTNAVATLDAYWNMIVLS